MTPYRPREFRFVEELSVGALRLKYYCITGEADAGDDSAHAQCLARARAYVAEEGARAVADSHLDHHGLGYLIVHFGEQRVWLLLHWWHGEDMLLSHLASAPPGSADFQGQDQAPFHACVWEHVVIHHEREAWVRHLLTDAPNPGAYLADRLPDGPY